MIFINLKHLLLRRFRADFLSGCRDDVGRSAVLLLHQFTAPNSLKGPQMSVLKRQFLLSARSVRQTRFLMAWCSAAWCPDRTAATALLQECTNILRIKD